MKVTALQNTILKTHPVDSNLKPEFLPEGFKVFKVPKDKVLAANEALMDNAKHARLTFAPGLTYNGIDERIEYTHRAAELLGLM